MVNLPGIEFHQVIAETTPPILFTVHFLNNVSQPGSSLDRSDFLEDGGTLYDKRPKVSKRRLFKASGTVLWMSCCAVVSAHPVGWPATVQPFTRSR